ncbi:MAG: uroporphyrinogen-III C-methyltransferase [Bacillota bacterium]
MLKGTVYLVGAGPGDPGLITLKGLECIKRADVLVYDRLASPRLISLAKPGAELIYAGKQPDRHTLTQEEINCLLVKLSMEGKTVTRLKGGDPYVFGRGGEEAACLADNDVPFEVVPGITSAIAVPAYAGIPVTHRSCNTALTIIAGNEDPSKENSSINWDKIATGAGTLVFLMGMANLPRITGQLISHGRPSQTPVALISWGTRPEQKTLTGTLADIAARAGEVAFANPAVIVVGEVVNMREKLMWFEKKPLFGRRILVTRSREQASELSAAIEDLGGEAVEFPSIAIQEPEDYSPLDRAIEVLSTFQWLIFTSVNGVEHFFRRLRLLGKDIRDLAGISICAIGPRTRDALEKYALQVDYVPGEYRAEEIISGLKDKVRPGQRILLPRADIARRMLPESLAAMGVEVAEVTAYRTIMGKGNSALIREMLQSGQLHVVTFTSSSTVKNFVHLLGLENPREALKGVTVACIGPITAATANQMGLDVDVTASEYTIPGLVRALAEHTGSSK